MFAHEKESESGFSFIETRIFHRAGAGAPPALRHGHGGHASLAVARNRAGTLVSRKFCPYEHGFTHAPFVVGKDLRYQWGWLVLIWLSALALPFAAGLQQSVSFDFQGAGLMTIGLFCSSFWSWPASFNFSMRPGGNFTSLRRVPMPRKMLPGSKFLFAGLFPSAPRLGSLTRLSIISIVENPRQFHGSRTTARAKYDLRGGAAYRGGSPVVIHKAFVSLVFVCWVGIRGAPCFSRAVFKLQASHAGVIVAGEHTLDNCRVMAGFAWDHPDHRGGCHFPVSREIALCTGGRPGRRAGA